MVELLLSFTLLIFLFESSSLWFLENNVFVLFIILYIEDSGTFLFLFLFSNSTFLVDKILLLLLLLLICVLLSSILSLLIILFLNTNLAFVPFKFEL